MKLNKFFNDIIQTSKYRIPHLYRLLILLPFLFFNLQNVNAQLNIETEVYALTKSVHVFHSNPCINSENIKNLEFNEEMKVNVIGFEKCKKTSFFRIILNDIPYYIHTNDLKFNYLEEDLVRMLKKANELELKTFSQINNKENIKFYKLREEEKRIELERKNEEERKKVEAEEYERKKVEFQNNQFFSAKKDSLKTIENELLLTEFVKLSSEQDKAIIKLRNEIISKGGVFISQFDVDQGEYDETSVTLGVINLSKKRVKYVSFVLQAINPVSDPIGSLKTVRGVGFIETDDIGVFEFENIWYESTLESVKIIKMKIEFEDGTVKTITKVNEIILSNSDIALSVIQYHKSETYQYGSLLLIENTSFDGILSHEIIFVPIFDKTDKYFKTIKLIDYKLWIENIEKILEAKRNNEVVKTDFFETTNYSTMIYLLFDYEKTLLSTNTLEELLIKLKTLMK